VFGDPVAEMIGVRWGRVPLMGKTLEGTLGGLAACLLASAPLAATSLGPAPLVLAAGAVAAALFELIPLPMDDNFTIPLGAGAVMTLVQALPAAGGAGVMMMSPLLEGALAATLR
jgi:dolichol kinase